MKLDLAFPCKENLGKMPDTDQGKFCLQCSKEVIDFTEMSKEEVIQILSKKKSCGIFRNDHLDKIKNKAIVHIRPKRGMFKRAVAGVTIFSLAMMGCDTSVLSENKTDKHSLNAKNERSGNYRRTIGIPIPPKIEKVDSAANNEQRRADCGINSDTTAPPTVAGNMVVGMMIEPEAQFPGGEDSMLAYLTRKVTFPKNDTSGGVIYAQFEVTEHGGIENVKIVHSFPGADRHEKEVLSVLAKMPKWKPAQQDGQPIRTTYTLPINFETE